MKGEANHCRGKQLSQETKAKIARSLTGKKRSLESRRKQSESVKGSKSHRYGKPRTHGRTFWVKTPSGETVFMRSRWEIYFADWLCKQGRAWTYEPQTFILPDGSAYTPDFLVDGVYYEVKGLLSDIEAHKMRLFREQNPSLRLELLDQAGLEEMGIQVGKVSLPILHLEVAGPRTRTCPTCQKNFIPSFRTTIYCCRACVPKRTAKNSCWFTCPVCGKTIKVFPSQLKTRATCSAACGMVSGAVKRSGAGHWTRKRV